MNYVCFEVYAFLQRLTELPKRVSALRRMQALSDLSKTPGSGALRNSPELHGTITAKIFGKDNIYYIIVYSI